MDRYFIGADLSVKIQNRGILPRSQSDPNSVEFSHSVNSDPNSVEFSNSVNSDLNSDHVKIPFHRAWKVNGLKYYFGASQGNSFRKSLSKRHETQKNACGRTA